ncbi:hypothetical protein DFH27DRAFT_386149 [Peziza echinospora]|nr:hypothetical protein DFH27DRAFT_386149 [Peziza echinospora]
MPRLQHLLTLLAVLLLSSVVAGSAYPPPPHLDARQVTRPPVRPPTPTITIDIRPGANQPRPIQGQSRPNPNQPRPVARPPGAANAPAPAPAKVSYCGKQPFKPTEYACYPRNNNFLCPIIGGVTYKPCGAAPVAACYDPDNYDCINGKLVLSNTCGGVVFDTNMYICIQKQLCPKTHANRCGAHCYHASAYWCDRGVLKQKGQA